LLKSAASVNTVEDFKKWTKEELRPLIPHECLISGWGHMHAGGVGLDVMVIVDFPSEHIETIRNRAGAIDTPILRRWLATEKPVMFDVSQPWPDAPPQSVESFRRFGLQNVPAHAKWVTDRAGGPFPSLYTRPA